MPQSAMRKDSTEKTASQVLKRKETYQQIKKIELKENIKERLKGRLQKPP